MWFNKLPLLYFLFTSAQSVRLPANHCVIPFETNADVTFWPLVFNKQGELLPTSSVYNIQSAVVREGESVVLSCGANYIEKYSPKRFVRATCLSDGKFQVKNELHPEKVGDLVCNLPALLQISKEVAGCPSHLTSVKFGIVNPIDRKVNIAAEACYSTAEGKTHFVHVRKGGFISSTQKIDATKIYNTYLQSVNYGSEMMRTSRYEFNNYLRDSLKIEQIPPFGMKNFIDSQFLSNYQLSNITHVPWNSFIGHSHLLNFELLKQDITDLTGITHIYIGTHGVTSLRNQNGDRVPIYLNGDGRFPAPEIVWIVVRQGRGDMAFSVFNDPSLNEDDIRQKSFCRSDCASVPWLKRLKKHQQFSVIRDGFVLCCDLKEFMEVVTEFPK